MSVVPTDTKNDNSSHSFPIKGNAAIIPDMTGASLTEGGSSGLVPTPPNFANMRFLRGDGLWATPINTTYPTFMGATEDTHGKPGLVPAAGAGHQDLFLRADGKWAEADGAKNLKPATHTEDGLMAAEDKRKLDSIVIDSSGSIQQGMLGATETSPGEAGLVPAPPAGAQDKFLRGDGTWAQAGEPGNAVPLPDGVGSAGTSTKYAREDHVHPKVGSSEQSDAADRLSTPRDISISGGAIGTPTAFDGTKNITIPITSINLEYADGILDVEHGGTGVDNLDDLTVGNATRLDGHEVDYFAKKDEIENIQNTLNNITTGDTIVEHSRTSDNATTSGTADKLSTPRTITLSGDVTGSTTFDGSANVNILTTIAKFVGASSAAEGAAGLVPAPPRGSQDKFLKADGTWAAPSTGGSLPYIDNIQLLVDGVEQENIEDLVFIELASGVRLVIGQTTIIATGKDNMLMKTSWAENNSIAYMYDETMHKMWYSAEGNATGVIFYDATGNVAKSKNFSTPHTISLFYISIY